MSKNLAGLKIYIFKKKLPFIFLTFGILIIGVGVFAYFTNDRIFHAQSLTGKVEASVPRKTVSTVLNAVSIPKPADWVDYGTVLEAGPEGAWDFQWAGLTPASVVKKNETYYFYYVASDGYRSHDGGPRHRAIGVATSQDGIHFTKYSGNPIMTHTPFDGEEEGANSAGITLDTNGDFVMYYGAAAGPGASINADGRVAVSSDGFDFTDIAMVLDHRDSSLYGYGDEIFPITAFQHNGMWYVYYQPNGGQAGRTLGLAWGSSLDNLPNSTMVLNETSGGTPVDSWGNVIWQAPDQIALFIQRLGWPNRFIEVRTASPDTPHLLSEPVEQYNIPNLKRGVAFLDTERNTWFMYYNDFDRFWTLKLAPADDPDLTPPTGPTNLSATPVSHDEVELSWDAAADPDTGVVIYNIYRDGIKIGSTKDWTFTDTGLSELSTYTYGVSAVNFHGTEGSTVQATVTTPTDTTPPTIISITSSVNPTQVTVSFSEPVDEATAEDIANYFIGHSITITDASLEADLKTITLTTSSHANDMTYVLTVNNVLDRAATPNPVSPNTQSIYMHSTIAGLVGCWNADDGTGIVATDVSGYGNDGLVNGAILQDGVFNGALHFDGDDDYVLIDDFPLLKQITQGNFTFAAWARPEAISLDSNGYGIVVRSGGHPNYFFGLWYDSDQKYKTRLINSPDETFFTLASNQMASGAWHHLAMVVDDTAKQVHLYLDGNPVSGSPQSYSGTLLDLDQEVGENHRGGEYYIGSIKPDHGAGSFFTKHFMGLIDDVRIYNRALSGTEVQNLLDLPCPKVFLPPAAPTVLTTTDVLTDQIDLDWTDNADDEANFELERSTEANSGSFGLLATLPVDVTTYSDSDLTPETEYCYRVRATNVAGPSDYSPTLCVTTVALPLSPPAAPTVLTTTNVLTDQINLIWTDNADNEDGFEVERLINGTFGSFTLLVTLPADTTFYLDTGLASETEYCYRVRATNSAGSSAYSPVLCVTTDSVGDRFDKAFYLPLIVK